MNGDEIFISHKTMDVLLFTSYLSISFLSSITAKTFLQDFAVYTSKTAGVL